MNPSRAMKVIAVILFFIASSYFISACKKSNSGNPDNGYSNVLNLPDVPFNYANISLPAYLAAPPIQGQINTPANNQITDWGATLGRVIFYDKLVSNNNSISCASCHNQADAFADVLTLSKGFAGGNTGRNSMGLTNAKYYPNGKFFWDERAATLEVQTLMPIQDHIEMGMNLDTLLNRMKQKTYYNALFTKAFGDATINSDRISKALSQFVRSIVSFQSKYDVGRAALPPNAPPATFNFTNFTAQENQGLQLFFSPLTSCAACHGTETFTAAVAKNNGLDIASTTDKGVGGVTNNPQDNGKFKVPSLRNVALTGPFMHDGRFTTLEQVVEHYNSGLKAHPNLDPVLKTPAGLPKQMNLTVAEKASLVAFLKTLTDQNMITDVKYSNPFK